MKWKSLFNRKPDIHTYDREHYEPVIRCSICTGEKTAGFLDLQDGHFIEIMLLRNDDDQAEFFKTYGIESARKIY